MIYGDTILKVLIDRGDIRNTYEGATNPASINLRLGDTFKRIKFEQPWIELGGEIEYDNVPVIDGHVVIQPGEFMLATTKEWIHVPITAAAFVQGRSSIGRCGLSVQNAGFIDPGFEGHITLELKNDSPLPIVLYVDYPVTQLIYMEAKDASHSYSGKYLGQIEATGSRMKDDILKPGKQKEVIYEE